MIERRRTRTVNVGGVKIGSGHPVVVQSMTKRNTSDVADMVRQIHGLEEAGCEIVRVAVRNTDDAKAITAIKKDIVIPLVADIHFDSDLAVEAIASGADKIRINPGNISAVKDLEKIIDAATQKNIPVRIGVNSGSLPEELDREEDVSSAMAEAALRSAETFQKKGFNDIVISLKASDASTTVRAYRRIALECDYPLHLGVTAAGLPLDGLVRSSIGIGSLLIDGIGDTVRVSLTGDPLREVDAARRILSSSGSRYFGPEIISCPTCGRCQVDLIPIVEELEEKIRRMTACGRLSTEKELTIAVMGCEVNGPGEAANADIGIAFGKGKGAVFYRGAIVKTVKASEAVDELVKMIGELANPRS